MFTKLSISVKLFFIKNYFLVTFLMVILISFCYAKVFQTSVLAYDQEYYNTHDALFICHNRMPHIQVRLDTNIQTLKKVYQFIVENKLDSKEFKEYWLKTVMPDVNRVVQIGKELTVMSIKKDPYAIVSKLRDLELCLDKVETYIESLQKYVIKKS